ncbi:MAG: helix-turn-helix transcriptional regulator [Cyanobacteria bacterium P01_B01_bin.77]
MDTFMKALTELKAHSGCLDSVLMKGILEGFMDGILLLTHQGELAHANSNAGKIIEEFAENPSQLQLVGHEITRIYQAVIDSCEVYYETPIVIESEINNGGLDTLRFRARWLHLEAGQQPLVLILLENQKHSITSLVTDEVEKYGLTRREAETWSLRRANYSYKEIAAELYISVNTVKKHMKNIRSKLKFHQFRQDSIAS